MKRQVLWYAAFAALLSTCFEPKADVCSGGVVCPAGFTCSRDGMSCVQASDQCGNGQTDLGEVCDDGNTAGGDGCSADCTSDETCGNGLTDSATDELCDDANTVAGDGCSADCKSDETCGNGVTDTINGETCDDANSTSGDGCSGTCQSNEECGDGIPDPQEECESSNMFTQTCDPDCTFRVCGDGVFNTVAEECDDGNTNDGDGCSSKCIKE